MKKHIYALVLFLVSVSLVSAAHQTSMALQGRVTTVDNETINGNLVVNISNTSSCSGNIFSETYNNVVQNSLFDVVLGVDACASPPCTLSLDYNKLYYLCFAVNNSAAIGGPYAFRGGQGEVGPEDIDETQASEWSFARIIATLWARLKSLTVENNAEVGGNLVVNGTLTVNGSQVTGGVVQGDVRQVIVDFVAASGETITAGDVVSFVNGKVEKGFGISHSSKKGFNIPGDIDYVSAVVLSSSKFVVVFRDEGNSNYGTAVVGSVSGSGVSFGSEFVFNSQYTSTVSSAALSDSKFVVAYKDSNNYGTAVVGSVSGSDISFGSEFVFNSGYTLWISVAALSSSKFVVGFKDYDNSNYGTAVVGSVSGSDIGFGSEFVFNQGDSPYVSVASLTSTDFVVVYRDVNNSAYGTAVVGSVSGTDVVYGGEHVFKASATSSPVVVALSSTNFVVAYGPPGAGEAVVGIVSGADISFGGAEVFKNDYIWVYSATPLSSSKFVVAYRDGWSTGPGRTIVGTISDTNITFGDEHVLDTGSTVVSIGNLSSTKFVAALRDNISFGTVKIGTISGTNITFGDESALNAGSTIASAVGLSDTKFIIAYDDVGNFNYGTTVVGTISDNNITFGSEYIFNSASTDYVSAVVLSSSKFVVVFRDEGNSNYGTAVVGSVSGSGVSFGSEFVFNSQYTSTVSSAALSDSKFVVAYKDSNNYGTAVVGSVSGSDISFGSEFVFNSGYTLWISVAALSSSKFVVGFKDYDNSNYGTAVVGSVSGSDIGFGSEFVFNQGDSPYVSVASLTSTDFVVVYRDVNNSAYGTAVVGSVSGTDVVYGGEHVFKASATSSPVVVALSSTNFVVAYGPPGAGEAVVGIVSGADISFGGAEVFKNDYIWVYSATPLSSSKFVVAYRDGWSTGPGRTTVGSTGALTGVARNSATSGQQVSVFIEGVSDVHSNLATSEIYYATGNGSLTAEANDNKIGVAISDTELVLKIP